MCTSVSACLDALARASPHRPAQCSLRLAPETRPPPCGTSPATGTLHISELAAKRPRLMAKTSMMSMCMYRVGQSAGRPTQYTCPALQPCTRAARHGTILAIAGGGLLVLLHCAPHLPTSRMRGTESARAFTPILPNLRNWHPRPMTGSRSKAQNDELRTNKPWAQTQCQSRATSKDNYRKLRELHESRPPRLSIESTQATWSPGMKQQPLKCAKWPTQTEKAPASHNLMHLA